jgi:hypothetical protein
VPAPGRTPRRGRSDAEVGGGQHDARRCLAEVVHQQILLAGVLRLPDDEGIVAVDRATCRAPCHPLGCVALLTGLVLSLGTRWGLLKYYWVVIALVLTTLSLAVLLLDMPRVSALAGLTRTLSADSAVMSSIPRSVSLC